VASAHKLPVANGHETAVDAVEDKRHICLLEDSVIEYKEYETFKKAYKYK